MRFLLRGVFVYQDFLPLVSKPARYINNEINAVHKDRITVKTKICLLFPDTYEVGMSHLGLRILYHVLNSRHDTVCERVFTPWTDYEQRLRSSNRPLTSLESNTPLAEFDIIGVTLQYELSYTNLLVTLDLANIPLRRTSRDGRSPVIVAGGPCTVNPEPLSEFIDAFFIGEAEEAVHELIQLRQQYTDKSEYLSSLAQCEGFYVPDITKGPVRRRYIQNLDAAPFPGRPILPLMKPVHDRISVEVARGCIRGCRFCQAGMIYRPYRERAPETVKTLIRESLLCTGYDEVSLSALSSGDYTDMEHLITELIQQYRSDRVSISLPSLRIGTLTTPMIHAIADIRKTGFTMAPEAASERLRRVINKPVSEAVLMDTVCTIFSSGWNVLKLYFMIGLPSEREQDVSEIARLCTAIHALGRKFSNRPVQLNVTVSTFVPKPHTPFQWLGQSPIDAIREKQAYLAGNLKKRGIALKFHNPEMSLLEAAFSRADRSIAPVLEKAFRLGCRFDGWSESFEFNKWTDAFQELGTSPDAYACRNFNQDDQLPWRYVQTGVTTDFLKREYRKAFAAEITENCRVRCEGCGMRCKTDGTLVLGKSEHSSDSTSISGVQEHAGKKGRPVPEQTVRIRCRYSKTGNIRFLSHLDLMTVFQRAAVRARIPLAFSSGFNPHPKIAYGPALPVGFESEAEYLDLETDPFVEPAKLPGLLNSTLPQGIRVAGCKVIPQKSPSLSGSIGRYVYSMPVPDRDTATLEYRIQAFMGRDVILIQRDGKGKDIRPAIEKIDLARSSGETTISIVMRETESVRARIQDVVEQLFEVDPETAALFRIRRTEMYVSRNGNWISPLDVN